MSQEPRRCALVVSMLFAIASTWSFEEARAATRYVRPSDPIDTVEATIGGLGPGDELIVVNGTYELSGLFSFDIAGTADSPIVIRGESGTRPHFHRAGTDQNLWDFYAEYVSIRGLRFSGGSAGLRVRSANHLTIEDCEIDHTRDVAIRMNDPGITYDNVQILRNEIHHTGQNGGGTSEGMYLGCNDDGCRLAHSVIQRNHVYAVNGPDVEQGDGIELKEGSHDNIISDNVIHGTHYPCILTYSAAGRGGPNIIERNLLFDCGDHGIQSARDAIIRNNIILSAGTDGIAMQPHQSGTPANLIVVHNTILKSTNNGISVRNVSGSVLVANNAIFAAETAIYVNGNYPSLVVRGNVGTGTAETGLTPGNLGEDFVNASFDGAPPMDVFPASGGALPGAGDARDVPADDFNGTSRQGVADVGAYAFAAGGNPGWSLAPVMKGNDSIPTVDAGVAEDAQTGRDSGAGRDAGATTSDARVSDSGLADASEDSGVGDLATDGGHADAHGADEADPGCDCRITPTHALASTHAPASTQGLGQDRRSAPSLGLGLVFAIGSVCLRRCLRRSGPLARRPRPSRTGVG